MLGEVLKLAPTAIRETYARNIKPSVRIATTDKLKPDLPGISKLGGLPGLPRGTAWPRWQGEPLSFVGQLNLSDVAATGFQPDFIEPAFPERGMLFFFCAESAWGNLLEDRGSARVIYYDGNPRHLRLAVPPEDLNQAEVYTPHAVRLTQEDTLPPFESFYFTDHHDLPTSLKGLTPTQDKALSRLSRKLDQLYDRLGERRHRLYGHPDLIQSEMQWRCQMLTHGMELNKIDLNREAELRKGILDWQLLLQVDSDPKLGTKWGHRSLGRYYFWIRKQDLSDRNFDYPWGVLQTF